MIRRLVAILAVVLGCSTAAAAVGPGRPTIGILYRFTYDDLDAQIVRSLREVGWTGDRGVTIERRYWEGRAHRLPALAEELVGRRVDVIVTVGTPAAIAVRHATTTIPIVMSFVSDPVRSGLVSGLAHPGGNLTGVAMLAPDASLKALQLLKEAVPSISRVGIVVDPANASHTDIVRDLDASARIVAVSVKTLELRRPADVDALLAAARRERIEALLILPGNLDPGGLRMLAQRLPTLNAGGNRTAFKRDGGMIYYGASATEQGKRVAFFVDRILRGAKPADLPVEQSSRFEPLINLRTAKALRLTIPPSLLLRADQVVE